jgi:hypothetical protein
MANQPPAQCATIPTGSGPCARLIYSVPDTGVSCEWVVALNANSTDATFLDENDDAAHYFMPKLSFAAAGSLMKNRPMPAYAPTSQPEDGITTVKVQVLVRDDGRVANSVILDGSAALDDLSLIAASDWTFKPLKIGNHTVAFLTEIDFLYSTHFNFPSNTTISTVTARP